MSGRITFGHFVELAFDGRSVTRPPNRTVLALAVGMADAGQDGLARIEVARRLYPGTELTRARTALRTSLSRLVAWLPEDVISVERETLALRGVWGFSLGEATVESYGHPWLDAVAANRFGTVRNPRRALAEAVVNLVQLAVRSDRVSAQGVLVGAKDALQFASVDEVFGLLSLTEPLDAGDPYAAAHALVAAGLHTRSGRLALAIERARYALRAATAARCTRDQVASLCTLVFACSEVGMMAEARRYASMLSRWPQATPLVVNALACYHWNAGENEEALALFCKSMAADGDENRSERAHLLVNAAYFAAEIGHGSISHEAERAARELGYDESSPQAQFNLWQLAAMRDVRQGRLDQAAATLETCVTEAAVTGHPLCGLYATELRCEVAAKIGRRQDAWEKWIQCTRRRRALASCPLNPRAAIRHRSMVSLCAS